MLTLRSEVPGAHGTTVGPLSRRSRRTKLMGVTGLGVGLPKRIPGIEQRVLTYIPQRCPKCGNRNLLLEPEHRRVSCPGKLAGCGSDWFLVAP